jgi:hypothetical protein
MNVMLFFFHDYIRKIKVIAGKLKKNWVWVIRPFAAIMHVQLELNFHTAFYILPRILILTYCCHSYKLKGFYGKEEQLPFSAKAENYDQYQNINNKPSFIRSLSDFDYHRRYYVHPCIGTIQQYKNIMQISRSL